MTAFDYSSTSDAIRDDLALAHRQAWIHVAKAGSWLTGAERVAVADETRRARSCALCSERKAALSPFSVKGDHEHGGVLSQALVDAVHRVVTDAGRLSSTWYHSLLEDGLSPESYVEALGVVVLVVSVDEFHHAMGMPPEPLPAPLPGEPSGYRPQGAEVEEDAAWVPVLSPKRMGPSEADLFAGMPAGQAPNVVRALSLVPNEVRAWRELAGAQYLSPQQMQDFDSPRAIDRAQIELVAGRVSALNECFY
jgi:alkylhydroperoxidase family enzyme